MPFDYEEYQKKCNTLTTEQLHKEWENYTRQISGGATSTATSVLFSPLTGGISLVGLGLSAPRIHNARKKREIVEAGLQARGTTHNTRKRDVIAPMAVAGTLGGLTLGLAGPGADMIAGAAVGHGMEYAVSHAALDATGAAIEHSHDEHSKMKANEKLQLQYQNFQQQYVQEEAKLEVIQPQLRPQSGLHVTSTAPQLSGPGTSQPGQILSSQLSTSQPRLQIPPPIPHHTRPGTPQPEQAPQLQPPTVAQEHKFENIPVPAAYNSSISYQPASHQQQFSEPVSTSQLQATNAAPSYQLIQQPEKYLVTVPAEHEYVTAQISIPEKLSACPTTGPQNGSNGTPPCLSPLPQYSSSQAVSMSQYNPQELSAQSTALSGTYPHPQIHLDLPPAPPTIEEEILFLKARLIQLELEKREAIAIQQEPPTSDVEPKESQPSLTPRSATVQMQQRSSYPPPPPPSQALLSSSSSAVSQQQTSAYQPQEYFPPPPTSPRPQSKIYVPPPPPPPGPLVEVSYTYNPQSYSPRPSSPNPQQEQQPQFQRNDSGYYSNASTPSTSNSLSQFYFPGQTSFHINPQATGGSQHNHNPLYSQPSPMSPAPPPYFPPPPGAITGPPGKDYFTQSVAMSSPNNTENQNYQGQSLQGTQGWQWGSAR